MPWQHFNGRLYLFQGRVPALLFGIVDSIGLATIGRLIRRRKTFSKAAVKKILISRPDHLGDMVMATAVLPVIKQAFPQAQLHMLVASRAREIAEKNDIVEKVIEFDHFRLNRDDVPSWRKFLKMFRQMPSVIRRIRAQKYDLGIELRPFGSNTIVLMWLGSVRYRIGHFTGGLGFLLHKAQPFCISEHFIENMLHLLNSIGISAEGLYVNMRLETSEAAQESTRKLLADSGIDVQRDCIVVLHPGSGRREAIWDAEKWAVLADTLQQEYNSRVVIAGGEQEAELAEQILGLAKTEPINITAVTSMPEFSCLVELSRLLIGLESLSSHVAAAVGTPAVVIHGGIQDAALWMPWGRDVTSVTKKVDCAPCWRKRGCDRMTCIEQVEVKEVIESAARYLS